tara:strand:- start:785 stop:7777 length:6993 start_codon:yes stop_codon:yes gene_type:complete
MAETSVEIYRRKLRELEDKRLKDEIGDFEYFSELDVLRKRLQEEQISETQLDYTPGEKEREYYFDVLGKLEGQGAANLYGERFEKMGMDPSEAFAKGKEKIAADTKKIRYGTGEFIEPLPSTFAVSDIVDPVKGLIKDPATGKVRKATTGEMVSSALFERQRKPTKLTTEEARYQFERDTEKFRKDLTTKAKLKKIGAGRGVQNLNLITLSPEEEEEIEQAVKERGPLTRLDVSRQPDSPAVIMETPLDYGLRLINTLSAVAEPAVKILQEGYRARQNARLYFRTGNLETMPKAKTRKGAGFKETEIEGTGGQILTNMLTGQGVFDRTQAQMLPPDEKASGIDYFMTQGTLPTMAMSLATELPIPITPLGIPGVGKAIKYPFRAFQSAAARAEIDLALRSAETKLTAKDLQTQIKVQGGTADTPTLRKKAAEVIGDQYGTHENARHLIKTKGPRELVFRDDFANQSTSYVEEIFKGASEVEIEDVYKVFDKMEEVFSGAVVGGKNEKIILRRVKQVANDTRDNMFTGKKPVRDEGIIKRAINRSKMEDLNVWNKARESGIPPEFSKTFDETYDILELQKHQQLTPDELIKLGKNFNILDEAGLLSFRKSVIEGKHIYAAVRNAVSDVMRDNFLKNVPDDMIYVGQNVAVSYKKATNKSLMDKFTKQVQPYFEETQEGILESFAAQKILRLQSRKGFELPSSLQEKVAQLANGVEVKLHPIESQYLTNVIKEEFALDLLDGVRIKTGTLTGQLAEVPRGALRQTLIKSGQAPTTSVIWGKSIANSIRLLLTKGGDYSQATGGRISQWFKVLSDDVPAPMRQLSTSVSRAHGAATDKVGAALQPPSGVRPEQHFQDTFNRYEQEAMDINLQRIEGNIRTGEELAIDSTARSEFVGEIDFSKQYAPRIESLIETRQSLMDDAFAKESERLVSNFENRLETSKRTLSQKHQKDLDRIERDYSREFLRNKSSVRKMRELHTQKYVEMMDDFDKKMKVAEDTLSKTYQKDFNKIRKDYEKEVLTASMNKRAAQQKLGDTRVQKIDQFEDAATTARQRLAKQQDNELERIHKAYSRKFIELRNKQRTVVSDYTTKATQTKKRFGLARQIKALDKEYKEAYDMVLNNKEVAEELLEQKIRADRKRLYNTFGKEDTAKIQKIQEVIDNAQTKYRARINKSVKEYKEMRKFLDESIAPEREEMFALMERIDVEDEIYQQKLKDLFNVEDKYKGKVDITINEYEQSQKLLSQVAKAERNALYDTIATLEEGEKYQKLKQATDTKLENLQQRIDEQVAKKEALQTQKSEKVATTRKLVQLSDTYGRDNVKDFLAQELGKSPDEIKYEDLIEQVDFIQENMQEASRQIYMAKTWKNMIKDFFVSPKDVEALDPRWVDNIDDLIRIDKSQPYWVAGNIKPLTIDTYKEVIGQLRELDQSLKNYGLEQTTLLTAIVPTLRKEAYVLPFIKKMIQTQRAMDMKVEIDNFITKSPDMFVNLDRAVDGTLGLRSTERLAKQITSEIKNTFSFAKSKGLADDEMIDLFTHQIREALFDGWAADIWKNSSRKVQTSFIEKYMTKVIQDGTPIINDMDGFVIDLYNSNILKSNTFESIEKKSREVLNKISSKFAEEGMTKEQGKVFEMLEKTLLSEEGLILDMRKQYLNNLTLRSDGVMDGLFTQQIESINDYFGRYGLNNETMLENVKRMEPRLKYMGARNIGVIYGDMHQKMMNEVVEIANNTKGKRFISELQTRFATAKNPQSNFAGYYFADAVNVTRRWSIARMLGGVLEPSTKFFGMNRMTAPYLFFAALGSGSMKASTAAKFTALATGGGLVPLPIVTAAVRKLGNKSFTGFIDSNKVMLAPAEEVLIRQSDGAVRNMTAGELREIMLNEGVMYSRADADFLDTQFNRLLIDAGITVDGLARYYNHPKSLARKIYDNLSPSGKNLWAEFAKFQDTEMRRYVFMQALKDGESIPNAAEKARRSMLDYGSLSDIEKNMYFRQIYFYSFMRTMGAETINAIYRGVLGDNFNPAMGLIKAQSRLNQETEDRAMSMQTDSRIYNLFKGGAEGQSSYMGGPVNPSVSMFDLMSRATLMMTAGIQSMTREQQDFEMSLLDSVSAALSATGTSAGETYISGNPFLSILMEGYRASKEERPIPFPSELQYEADKNGNMLEVIEQYGLEPRHRTAGRPLTTSPVRDKTTGEILYPAGTYFDFPRTSKGLDEGYNLYLWQRVVGLTAFAEVFSRSGLAPAAMTRFHKDTLRASMASARDPRMEGREGEVRIPMESVYTKTLNQQDLDMRSNIVYALYMLGLATPVKATKRNVIMERLLRNAQKQIKQTEDKLNEQR